MYYGPLEGQTIIISKIPPPQNQLLTPWGALSPPFGMHALNHEAFNVLRATDRPLKI